MTQRLLIHLNDAIIERHDASRLGNAVAITTTNTESDKDDNPATRSQFVSTKDEWTIPDLDSASAAERADHVAIQIQIERTEQVEDNWCAHETETSNMQRPRNTWTSHKALSETAGEIRDTRDDWLMSTKR